MPFSFRLLELCSLALLLVSAPAQTVSSAQAPTPGTDGVYEVAPSDLKRLDSSPKVEFPRELSAYELADTVVIEVTLAPDGRVKKAKALSGNTAALKEAAEKALKKWAFQPYMVNGAPVPARTQITLNFDNTFNRYRGPNGDVPVHLDEKTSRALIVKSISPQYPPAAAAGRIQGAVELRVIVGKDGRVNVLHIIKGHPMLAPAAYNAVRMWEFKPYLENGKNVPVDTTITVNFTLF